VKAGSTSDKRVVSLRMALSYDTSNMTPLLTPASTGKLVRLFLKNGSLHYQYQRGAHRTDPEVVLCGVGPGLKAFLRKKGLDYYEVHFAEGPLPL
jgi:hypothetical protein